MAVFVIISSIFLTFLALPAKASLEFNGYIKGLDEEIVLNFSFVTQKDDIKISIHPPIDFEYKWSGFLANQSLKIKPTSLLKPDENYTVRITNAKNTFELSPNDRTFSFKYGYELNDNEVDKIRNSQTMEIENIIGPNYESALANETGKATHMTSLFPIEEVITQELSSVPEKPEGKEDS